MKPAVSYRWHLEKVNACSWFHDDKRAEDDEDKNEKEVEYADSDESEGGESEDEGSRNQVFYCTGTTESGEKCKRKVARGKLQLTMCAAQRSLAKRWPPSHKDC